MRKFELSNYDCPCCSWWRSPELLLSNKKVIALVKDFAEQDKISWGLAMACGFWQAADILRGKKCAAKHV
ncbi:unnamed protein product [Rhodiola kirilowii]